jgi:hypothetical protein
VLPQPVNTDGSARGGRGSAKPCWTRPRICARIRVHTFTAKVTGHLHWTGRNGTQIDPRRETGKRIGLQRHVKGGFARIRWSTTETGVNFTQQTTPVLKFQGHRGTIPASQ